MRLPSFSSKPRVQRSSQWPGLRRKWLKTHPKCAVCSTTKHLEVHHIQPVHLFPEKELVLFNLITLCETRSHNDHFIFGHLFNWKDWNPTVIVDAENWRVKLETAVT